MEQTWKINGESYVMLNNRDYFNEKDREFAIFLYDIDNTHIQNLTQYKSQIEINFIYENLISFFTICVNNTNYAFEIYKNTDKIKNMIDNKTLEIGIAFKKNDVLLEDLCFTIDY